MKKDNILTETDKEDIINNLNKFNNECNELNVINAVIVGAVGIVGALISLTIGIFHDPLAFKGVGLCAFGSAFSTLLTSLAKRVIFKKIVTKKISYGKFKQLEKSGEIAKWQKQLNSTQIEITDFKESTQQTETKLQEVLPLTKQQTKNNDKER